MKRLLRLLFIGLAAPGLLAGCTAHQIKGQTAQQKMHQKRWQAISSYEELADVNRFWNQRVIYTPDTDEDLWQSPEETLKLGTGDCEDISIAKMFDPALLNTIPSDQLRLSYVHTPEGVPHMVLVVGRGDQALVLDNRIDEIKSLAESGYRPVYQLDANGRVYQNDIELVSHSPFEKFESILVGLNESHLLGLKPSAAE